MDYRQVVVLLALSCMIALSEAQDPPVARSRPEVAIFAGGRFWCMQPPFDKVPGVIKTDVGYCGGTEPSPTYEAVSSGKTTYRESIEITYDPATISYAQLIEIYWRQIDPTQSNGQFKDLGQAYRTAIFYQNDREKQIAEITKDKLQHSGKFKRPVVTEILPATKFYPAEASHQKYYLQHPEQFAEFEKTSGRDSFRKREWSE
jgi:methionine-S-sulfoxide reductase